MNAAPSAVGVLREVVEAAAEVERISSREHEAWFRLRAALTQADAALASLEAAEEKEVRSGYRATVHELLTNIKRACIRGRSARQTDNNLISTCDHIENMADEALGYFAPPAAASDGEGE